MNMLARILGLLLCCALIAVAGPAATAATTAKRAPVLVFGGSGQLGSEIVRALVAKGYPVTVFLRPTSNRSRIERFKVSLVEGDVLQDADVERAMKSQRFGIVINALGRSESDYSFYASSGESIARWAKATGVRQVILHSSVGVGASRAAYPPGMFNERSALFPAKEVAERALIDSGVTYTIIRNAVLRDPLPQAPERARLSEDQTTFGVVSRRGLARLTLECIDQARCANRIFHAIDATLSLQ